MDVASLQIKKFQYVIVSLTLASALFIHASLSEPEPTFVDFSKKMIANQSSEEYQGGSVIRVAMAAMISAKESVAYFHHLHLPIRNQISVNRCPLTDWFSRKNDQNIFWKNNTYS